MFNEQSVNQVGSAILGLLMKLTLHLDVQQHVTLPAGPKIIAANHPATTDPFYLLGLMDEPLTLLVTEMAFHAPVIGALIRAAGHIPVMHENGQAALISAIERLRSGESLGIFPEGSLSPREGGLCRARTGTVRLALEAGVPVIPVGIALDPQRIRYVETTFGGMTETARYYLQGPYAITIGQALTFDGSLEDRPYVQRESARLMERIGALACASTRRLMLTAGVPVVA